MSVRSTTVALTLGLSMLLLPTGLRAQELEELKRLVQTLQAELQAQGGRIDELAQENSALKEQVDGVAGGEALATAISSYLAAGEASDSLSSPVYELVKIFNRSGKTLFTDLTGGLVFTGYLRTRFEVRENNADFQFNNDRTVAGAGFDDEGFRFNGRFRLGFGANLLPDESREESALRASSHSAAPQVKALTEFQAYGSFANNSFVNQLSPSGVSNPSPFSILSEPFESIALYQGYLSFENLIAEGFEVKVGRQEIVKGNEFILGRNGFYDGTVHDSLTFAWDVAGDNTFDVSGFLAKEAASDGNLGTSGSDFDEDLFLGLYFQWLPNTDRSMVVDGYAVYFDARSNSVDLFKTGSTATIFDGSVAPIIEGHFWTLGARFFWGGVEALGGEFSFNFEAAYMTGNDSPDGLGAPAVTDQSIHGWALEFITNFRFDLGESPAIASLAYYYAGGGNVSGSHVGFQPLFINRHFDYGARSLATPDTEDGTPYVVGGGRYGNLDIIPLNNIHVIKAAFAFQPSLETELGISYLFAFIADNEGYGTGGYGHELDIFGRYSPALFPKLHFTGSLSVLFPERGATALSNSLFTEPGSPSLAGNEPALVFYLQALIEF